MKTLAFTGIIASGVAAAVLGLAAPAQADYGHHQWIGDMSANAPLSNVDTSHR